MEIQSSLDFLMGTKKPKAESATGFDSALQFLQGLSAPPVAPLTQEQAAAQFAQIPHQPVAMQQPQTPQAQQGNIVQRAIAPAASFLDVTLGGVAPGIVQPVTYAGSRAFGATPEQATASSQAAAAPFVDPFGKALGVTELPQYKGEATRQIMDFVGANMAKGAGFISEQTGLPVADVENMMQTLSAGGGVAGSRALAGRMGVSPAVSQVQDQFRQAQTARGRVEPAVGVPETVAPDMAAAIPETGINVKFSALNEKLNSARNEFSNLLEQQETLTSGTPEYLAAIKKTNKFYDDVLDPLNTQYQALQSQPVTPEGTVPKTSAAEVSFIKTAPDVPASTPFITSPLQERIAPNSTTTPRPTIDNPFVEPMYAKTGKLPVEEQLYRVQTVNELGIPRVREGTRTGDGFQTANEYVTAKTSGPNKELFNEQIAAEQSALRNYARGIVEKTGGSLGLDENALYNRGQAIAQPFDAFKNLLTEQMRGAYQAAGQVAQGAPAVDPSTFQKFLNTNSNFVVNDSYKQLRKGIQSHLSEQGLTNKDGSIKPMTVDQSELLRQYINSNWNRDRSGIIHKLTDSIDNDVTRVAGLDIYESARGIRRQMAQLLEDPVGVSKIMDYDPKTPINRATAFPDIPKAVERMTPDQQQHLIKVLQEMPEGLQPQAQRAIAEIKSQFANTIAEIGGKGEFWNAPAVSKYLKDNNRSLRILTNDPEMARSLTVLNDGGHFLRMDNGYKGAAIQFKNMYENPLISGTAQALGGAVGGALGYGLGYPFGGAMGGGAVGGGIGAGYGRSLAAGKVQRASERASVKKGQESLKPIQDVLKTLQKKQ
jgi:hypothetical protein